LRNLTRKVTRVNLILLKAVITVHLWMVLKINSLLESVLEWQICRRQP
jgi:hypothetical protein